MKTFLSRYTILLSAFTLMLLVFFTSCKTVKHAEFIPEECAGELFEVSYGAAMQYISNFDSAMLGSVQYSDSMIIKGNNIPYCMEFAVQRSKDWSTYYNMGGLKIFYGLRGSADSPTKQRLALLLPLNKQGNRLSLTDDRAIVGLHLPEGFANPCPPDCDYVKSDVKKK